MRLWRQKFFNKKQSEFLIYGNRTFNFGKCLSNYSSYIFRHVERRRYLFKSYLALNLKVAS